MPTYGFTCEVCGAKRRAWRKKGEPPRFCSKECQYKWLAGQNLKRVKFPITPEIHVAIEKVYKRDTGNGQVAALARRLGYPRWRVTRYAVNQGWVPKQRKEPDWAPQELKILERNAHLGPDAIQRKLKVHGYHRSITGIVIKRKRMRLLRNLDGQSANALADCLGVDLHFIMRAIREGRLKASRRGTKRTPQQGGDMYYIKDKHARDYVVGNIHEIDIRKVDKYWFVDLLTNRLAEKA